MDEQDFVEFPSEDRQKHVDRLLELARVEQRLEKVVQALYCVLFILLSVGAWILLSWFGASGSTTLILLGTIMAVGISVGTLMIIYQTIRDLIG